MHTETNLKVNTQDEHSSDDEHHEPPAVAAQAATFTPPRRGAAEGGSSSSSGGAERQKRGSGKKERLAASPTGAGAAEAGGSAAPGEEGAPARPEFANEAEMNKVMLEEEAWPENVQPALHEVHKSLLVQDVALEPSDYDKMKKFESEENDGLED